METARVPANEAKRLAALRRYGELDSIVDESLDALVRSVAVVCQVPIALVSLVEETRQRFVANFGLEGIQQTARDESFCAHALLRPEEVMIVDDATHDRRFFDNPLVTGLPGIRFYAGAPLVDDSGAALGSLCAIDRQPRTLSSSQLAVLRDLSTVAAKLLEMRRVGQSLELTAGAEAEARAQLQIVIETAPNMIAYWNTDLTNRFANAAYRRFFGCVGPTEGRHVREVTGEQLFVQNEPLLRAALAGVPQRFTRSCETNGRTAFVIGDYSPDLRDGKVHGVVASLRDVTHELSKRAELLALSEQVADVGHWRLDSRQQTLFWSPQIYRILGLDPARFVPTLESAVACYHPDDREHVSRVMSDAIERGEGFDFELRVVRPSGEIRRVHSRGRCERDPEGVTEVYGVFQDLTEREALRERLARQEKLATVGTLAAGVGHEINNPLTLISANIEHALGEIAPLGPPLDDVAIVLREVREGAERIRKIVRSLRSFAREDVTPVPTDLEAAVNNAAQMAMYEMRSRATLEILHGDARFVLADEGRLSQIVLNLLVNAAQAFVTHDPTENRVTVRTGESRAGAVTLEIADNGPGIAPEILGRIFDPFFTTKPVGQGTGLGLSISQSLASSLGGELTCTTQLGKGTTFRLTLPAATPAAPPSGAVEKLPEVSAPSPLPPRGRVMIIDDEPAILRIFTRILKTDHEVVSFSDPREARRALLEPGAAFDVVFCDLMMPHLTGMQLHQVVLAARPELATRFVFTSGGVAAVDAETFLREVSNERLEKPFSHDQVRAIARRFTERGSG